MLRNKIADLVVTYVFALPISYIIIIQKQLIENLMFVEGHWNSVKAAKIKRTKTYRCAKRIDLLTQDFIIMLWKPLIL